MTDATRNIFDVKREFDDVAKELSNKSGITAEGLLSGLTREQVRLKKLIIKFDFKCCFEKTFNLFRLCDNTGRKYLFLMIFLTI
jgi:hypothetical protein